MQARLASCRSWPFEALLVKTVRLRGLLRPSGVSFATKAGLMTLVEVDSAKELCTLNGISSIQPSALHFLRHFDRPEMIRTSPPARLIPRRRYGTRIRCGRSSPFSCSRRRELHARPMSVDVHWRVR